MEYASHRDPFSIFFSPHLAAVGGAGIDVPPAATLSMLQRACQPGSPTQLHTPGEAPFMGREPLAGQKVASMACPAHPHPETWHADHENPCIGTSGLRGPGVQKSRGREQRFHDVLILTFQGRPRQTPRTVPVDTNLISIFM
eukprot:1138195-Pelagomonas_calceolata.AAC.3